MLDIFVRQKTWIVFTLWCDISFVKFKEELVNLGGWVVEFESVLLSFDMFEDIT